jgi:hypothetical protein
LRVRGRTLFLPAAKLVAEAATVADKNFESLLAELKGACINKIYATSVLAPWPRSASGETDRGAIHLTDFDPASLPAILGSSWLELGVVLLGTAVFGGMAYRHVRRAKRPAEAPAPIDQTRRTLVSGGCAAKKPEQPLPNIDWKTAPDAVEAYAAPELLQARDHWMARCKAASDKEAEAQRHIDEIRDRFPEGEVPKEADVRQDFDQAERQQRVNARVVMNAQQEIHQLRLDIHSDVYKKLCVGTLLAKGVREPRVAGSSEIQIPSAEWRMLMLLHVDAKAVQKGIDGKLVYSGIVIGKAGG